MRRTTSPGRRVICPRHRTIVLAAAVIPALLLAACGNGSEDVGPATDAVVDSRASGSITISGSSTVEPITALVREDYIAQNANVDISVDGPGTGDGFELFCNGETDISDASRPIRAEEARACAERGIEFIELEVGIDGIAVVTNPANPVECLSFPDLYALVGPESEGFGDWTNASELAAALGSDTELPDENLVVTAPGAESGTYDTFVELVIEKAGEPRVAEGEISEDRLASARADYSAQSDDNVIIETTTNDTGGLGWVGFAYADVAKGVQLMPVAEEAGGDCVEPTTETIQDGSYPISRSLYLYVNKARAAESEALRSFVDFYLDGLTGFVEISDYIPLADEAPTRVIWDDQTAGTREG